MKFCFPFIFCSLFVQKRLYNKLEIHKNRLSMKASSPALVLYIVSGLLYFIAVVEGIENLTLIVKPIIIPSIFFYYWQESRGKISFWSSMILLLLFVSGILNLFYDERSFFFVILSNFIAYCILLCFVFKNIFEIKFQFPDKINLSYMILMFLFFLSLLYFSLVLMFDLQLELYLLIIVYGISSVTFGSSATILYTLQQNQTNFFLMMTSFTFIVSDLFFVMYHFYNNFIFFMGISILSYVVSFYVLVYYFLLAKKDFE